eukprot:TRINITY_DN4869_c0_g2_i3.p1 TRINITY_DN4869_c0_g2~~TRINITY_DN4869_c0_g2_i3.p1  ORF type:complete len:280 (+),score=71.36 TRINITY_DN4869_c0_g2_i3:74-913(+)
MKPPKAKVKDAVKEITGRRETAASGFGKARAANMKAGAKKGAKAAAKKAAAKKAAKPAAKKAAAKKAAKPAAKKAAAKKAAAKKAAKPAAKKAAAKKAAKPAAKKAVGDEARAKQAMLEHLVRDVWARCGVGAHGIGVIAVRDIPKGTVVDKVTSHPFPRRQQPREVPLIGISPEEMLEAGVDPHVIRYMHEMYVCREGLMQLSALGANCFLGLGTFINHSAVHANCAFMELNLDGDVSGFCKVVTTDDVKCGEELRTDYRSYVTDEELAYLPGMSALE